MYTIKCDRCHKEVENYIKSYFNILGAQVYNTVKLEIGLTKIDLCGNCQLDLKKWMRQPSPIATKRYV